jgi:unsaturated chondroitin disaccharide hydrolase
MLRENDKQFAAEFLERVAKKVSIMAPQIGGNFPYTDNNTGQWRPKGEGVSVFTWTNGYWPGMMWLMYIKTGDETYRNFAEECEEKLDEAFDRFTGLHHDVGFMWELTSVANYKITENPRSRARALHAATILAGRFNPAGKFIRAWNWTSAPKGYAIIDSVMNIPILEWAAKDSTEPDPRFSHIARMHADTLMNAFVRPDGSVHHIVDFDPDTGEVVKIPRGQGYAPGSSWSRGQAWAVYGFVTAYLNAGKQEYLDTAKRVAHYFISNMKPGELPLLDFRAPKEPVYYDASAAAITACGLIEIARAVDETESDIYYDAAMDLLRVLDKNCNYNEDELVLLENNSGSYHGKESIHRPYIFGDYYLLEALMKLYGNDGKFIIHNA